MKKFPIWAGLLFTIFLLFPSASSAHTGLRTASPGEGEVITNKTSEIKLTFGTRIEPLSRLELLNAAGEKIEVEVETGKDFMTGTLQQPMENGTYTVEWRIIGADSHVVKGSYTFVVDLPAAVASDPPANQPAESNSEPIATANEQVPENESNTSTDNASPSVDEAELEANVPLTNATAPEGMNTKTWIGIGALAVCLVLIGFGIRNVMKHNK